MKKRLDVVVLERGLAASRQRARALIMEGKVTVDGRPIAKAGTPVDEASDIRLIGPDIPYVGRGALKLEAAVERFGIELAGKTAMDVGAGTGGFTDYMLRMGARRVYAIDVGYGQFDWRLRNDPRVVLFEKTNIRYLERKSIPEDIDIAAVDVSFISLTKVVPKVVEFLKPAGEPAGAAGEPAGVAGEIVALIKPQFEVGKGEVGKGGIVRDDEKRHMTVMAVKEALEGATALKSEGMLESPIRGHKGNIEYLIYMRRPR